jgi:hypothetical protein
MLDFAEMDVRKTWMICTGTGRMWMIVTTRLVVLENSTVRAFSHRVGNHATPARLLRPCYALDMKVLDLGVLMGTATMMTLAAS